MRPPPARTVGGSAKAHIGNVEHCPDFLLVKGFGPHHCAELQILQYGSRVDVDVGCRKASNLGGSGDVCSHKIGRDHEFPRPVDPLVDLVGFGRRLWQIGCV